jgi:hypothetical protein
MERKGNRDRGDGPGEEEGPQEGPRATGEDRPGTTPGSERVPDRGLDDGRNPLARHPFGEGLAPGEGELAAGGASGEVSHHLAVGL